MKVTRKTKNEGTYFTWTGHDRLCFIATAVVVGLMIYFGLQG